MAARAPKQSPSVAKPASRAASQRAPDSPTARSLQIRQQTKTLKELKQKSTLVRAKSKASQASFQEIRAKFQEVQRTIHHSYEQCRVSGDALRQVLRETQRAQVRPSLTKLSEASVRQGETVDLLELKQQVLELEQLVHARTFELDAANRGLKLQTQELIRFNAELERFAYLASHDLKEPLRTVSSFTKLLATRYRGKLDCDGDEFMGYVLEGVDRMEQQIDDVLAYYRIGATNQKPQQADLNVILQRVLDTLNVAGGHDGASVTHDQLPVLVVNGTEFLQVFHHLIGNALKFHGEERPRIHVSALLREGLDGLREWLFTVQDNGIGIEPEYIGRIFGIFQKLHTRQEFSGNGIGLAICKKVVENHGGRIWVESAPGKGSTFYFTVPVD